MNLDMDKYLRGDYAYIVVVANSKDSPCKI